MSATSLGFFRRLPSALPGLALIVVILVVIRNWIELRVMGAVAK